MRTVGILTVVFFVGAAYAATSARSGYLDGPDDYETWDLNLKNKVVDVVFTWPLGTEYWVTVYGMYGDELGSFNLVEGETIQLSGGGKFTIKIFSCSGSGSWTATWEDKG